MFDNIFNEMKYLAGISINEARRISAIFPGSSVYIMKGQYKGEIGKFVEMKRSRQGRFRISNTAIVVIKHDDGDKEYIEVPYSFMGVLHENIFKPATKDEIEQRKIKRAQSVINKLVNRKDCIKYSDGSYSFKNNVNLSELNLIKLPIKFKQVDGNFNCSHNKLTSLQESPKIVKGGFYCYDNQLTSLKGAPEQVGGNFYCSNNQLTTLEGSPEIVKGGFYCSYNQLTSLEGAPKYVGHYFDCSSNQLTSLKGAPKQAGGYFDCSYNQLTSLEGTPEQVDGDFYCSNNKLTNLKGAPKIVEGDFYCSYNKIKFTKDDVKKICNVKGKIYV